MVLYHNKYPRLYQKQFQLKRDITWYIYSNFKCIGNTIHVSINVYEGTYNVGNVLNCITDKGQVNCNIIEKYDYYKIGDKDIEGSDIFINGKL